MLYRVLSDILLALDSGNLAILALLDLSAAWQYRPWHFTHVDSCIRHLVFGIRNQLHGTTLIYPVEHNVYDQRSAQCCQRFTSQLHWCIFSWFWQWNNFENRLVFGKVKAYRKNCAKFFGHPVVIKRSGRRLYRTQWSNAKCCLNFCMFCALFYKWRAVAAQLTARCRSKVRLPKQWNWRQIIR